MLSLKKWLGLKLWVAIWLLVLLLPTWREDAREQWSGKTWNGNYYADNYKRGLTKEKIEAVTARAPADFAAQLELLTTPGSFNSFDKSAHNDDLFAAYIALSDRFPRENEIRKSFLLNITRGDWNIEPASSYANVSPQNRPKPQKIWLSRAQLGAALNAARDGARIEPQNSFFPWMECALHFALKRPADAMAALERAANCATFDDGTSQTARRRIELLSRVQSVSWSDKSRSMWGLLLPHFSKISSSSRAAMEIAEQAQKRGDKARALQIAALTARAGATISDSANFYIVVTIGDFIQRNVWIRALKNAGLPAAKRKNPSQNAQEHQQFDATMRQEDARRIATLARELKQEAIAKQVLATLPNLRGPRLDIVSNAPFYAGDGLLQRTARMAQLSWIQAELLRLSLAGALLWIVALGLSLQAVPLANSRRGLAIWAAFCLGVTAVLLIAGSFFFALAMSQETSGTAGGAPLDWRDYQNKLNGSIGALWLFPAFWMAIWNSFKFPRWDLETRGFGSLRPLKTLFYALIASSLIAVTWFHSQRFSSPEDSDSVEHLYNLWIWVALCSIGIASAFHILTATGKTRIAAVLFWSVPLLLLAARTMLHPVFEASFIVVLLALSLFFLICSARLTGWRPAPAIQQFGFDLMARARILAATLAVASSLSYLGVRIVALPAEVKMNALIDRQLQIGEVAWLENELAQAK